MLSFDDDAPVEEGAAAKGKTRKASWDEGGEIQESVKSKRKGTFVNTKGDYLPWKTKLIYAMPGIATISVTFFIAVYLADFYVSLGVSLSFVGFFTALARAFDVITDPLMGWITDNARTKYGRRRPFIGVGCFFYCLFLVLLMSPPGRIVENSGNNNETARRTVTAVVAVKKRRLINSLCASWDADRVCLSSRPPPPPAASLRPAKSISASSPPTSTNWR